MGKKHKKKHKREQSSLNSMTNSILSSKNKSKKDLTKEFRLAIEEIEAAQIKMMEADKKKNKKQKKKINKKEAEFYTSMDSIKCRKKIEKKWRKNGFFDTLIELLNEVEPIVKLLAKLVCGFIITFLSIDFVKEKISPKVISKLSKIFDVASNI